MNLHAHGRAAAFREEAYFNHRRTLCSMIFLTIQNQYSILKNCWRGYDVSRAQLRRRRELLDKHEMLMDELYEITDSPEGIEHFEDHYIVKGASLKSFRRRLKRMRQFPKAVKMHMREHFEVKHETKRLNKKLWRLR